MPKFDLYICAHTYVRNPCTIGLVRSAFLGGVKCNIYWKKIKIKLVCAKDVCSIGTNEASERERSENTHEAEMQRARASHAEKR